MIDKYKAYLVTVNSECNPFRKHCQNRTFFIYIRNIIKSKAVEISIYNTPTDYAGKILLQLKDLEDAVNSKTIELTEVTKEDL